MYLSKQKVLEAADELDHNKLTKKHPLTGETVADRVKVAKALRKALGNPKLTFADKWMIQALEHIDSKIQDDQE